MSALAADDRPFDFTPIQTSDLPPTPTRDRNIAATAWVEAPAELLQLGELLGRVHNQASTWSLPRHFHRHALDAEGLMGERPFWGPFWKAGSLSETQRSRFTAIRLQIFEILSQLPTHPDGFSLIHADLHPGNVVMNDQRLHLIDFDDAGFGWHAYDLAVALKDYQDHPRFEDFRAALILGYQSVRPVHEQMLDLIPLFLLIRALASIGWAEARPELDLDDYPARLAAYAEERAGSVLAPFV